MSILVIGDAASPNGVIEAVVNLNGVIMPKDGILLIAESTFTLGTADAVRSMNLEDADTVTYMLVFNFTGLASNQTCFRQGWLQSDVIVHQRTSNTVTNCTSLASFTTTRNVYFDIKGR